MLEIGNRSSSLSRRVALLLADEHPITAGASLGRRWHVGGVLAAIAVAALLSTMPLAKSPYAFGQNAFASLSPIAAANRSARTWHAVPPGTQPAHAPPHGTSRVATANGTSTSSSELEEPDRNPEACKPELAVPGDARQKAVSLSLEWLVRHQSADGGWRFAHGASCPIKQADGQGACSGEGNGKADTASTGIVLLALMAAGHQPGVEGPYREAIDRGVEWLVQQQADDGKLYGMGGSMYNQGIATLALCEAYQAHRARQLEKPAQRAIDFIVRAQDKGGGGWRYQPGMPGDTSVYGWQVLALRSAQQARLIVDADTFAGARKYLKSVARGPDEAFYAYVPDGFAAQEASTLNAIGPLAKQLLGAAPDDKSIAKGIELLAKAKPDMGPARDSYRWFFSSQAIDRSSNAAERIAWQAELSAVLVRSQETAGCKAGSWDPARPAPDKWAPMGGRVMVTALSAIALSAGERRLAIFKVARGELD